MQKPLMNDASEYPDDAVLARYLGKAKPAWDSFVSKLAKQLTGASLEWRYYNDGKAWLCKLTHKKKTVCWISVWEQSFKTSFYFTQKNDAAIEALAISAPLKQAYRAHESTGKLKPLVVHVKTKKALDDVFTILTYKSASK